MIERGVIKRHWLSDSEIRAIADFLSKAHNKEHLIIFSLLLSTGQKFSRLSKVTWDCYNSRLSILRLGDKAIAIPHTVATNLETLREQATGETAHIFKMPYKRFWSYLEKACVKLDIEQSGVLILRNTFARRHFETYHNRKRLMRDLNLTSLRHLPRSLFKQTRPQALFQGVL